MKVHLQDSHTKEEESKLSAMVEYDFAEYMEWLAVKFPDSPLFKYYKEPTNVR